MVTSTIDGFADTITSFWWNNLWIISSGTSFTNLAGNAIWVSPSTWIGFVGAAFAFLLSTLGAAQNASQMIYAVEDGLDDWLKGYGKGKYEAILADQEKSDEMQWFLQTFTIDLIVYAFTSMAHSLFLMGAGFTAACLIFWQVITWEG